MDDYPKFDWMTIIGVPVSVVTLSLASRLIVGWAAAGRCSSVFVRDVHGVMRCRTDDDLMTAHHRAQLVVPDGMPLVWIGRMRGFGAAISRVPGYDLVDEVCRRSIEHGLKHYFFGGKPGVADSMAEMLSSRHPGLIVAGTYSPPMRNIESRTPLSDSEIAELRAIADSGAHVIWVGISTPKQEHWIAKASQYLDSGVLLGVGAAFDNHANIVPLAPRWVRGSGLEWFYRLIHEPRRLWRRYLVLAPLFIFLEIGDELRRLWNRLTPNA